MVLRNRDRGFTPPPKNQEITNAASDTVPFSDICTTLDSSPALGPPRGRSSSKRTEYRRRNRCTAEFAQRCFFTAEGLNQGCSCAGRSDAPSERSRTRSPYSAASWSQHPRPDGHDSPENLRIGACLPGAHGRVEF